MDSRSWEAIWDGQRRTGHGAGQGSVTIRALALAERLCWESLNLGDTAAFNRQAAVCAELRGTGLGHAREFTWQARRAPGGPSAERAGDVQPDRGGGELGGHEGCPDRGELPGAQARAGVAGDPPGDQGGDRAGDEQVRADGGG